MTIFITEPRLHHRSANKIGILLINLGTPDAPRSPEVRRYLAEFLSDSRVVELPKALWNIILYGVILPTRSVKSARKYASIWDAREGSPLRFHTDKQAKLLEGWLAQHMDAPFDVAYAMRYGQPSIATELDKLLAKGCDHVLCVPMYPQYASASTGSAMDGVYRHLLRRRRQPALRAVIQFYDQAAYIAALAHQVQSYWQVHGQPQVLVMSFHGIPVKSVKQGDPYYYQCMTTARLLAQALGLKKLHYAICFQSRFGAAKWLRPATDSTLKALGKAGTRRVDVVCPGFVADCLETLEEIAMEGKADFLAAGGGEFHYIPALNERSDWIAALGEKVLDNLQGWCGTRRA